MRWLRVAVATVVLAGVSGCGDGSGGEPAADTERAPSTNQDDSASDAESNGDSSESDAVAGDYPCSLLGEEDLTTVLGQPLGSDSAPGSSQTIENDLTWTSRICRWGDEDTLELRLSIAEADDFPDGVLMCPEPTGVVAEVTPVSGIGTQAWWEWVERSNTVKGSLRVCTDAALVELSFETPEGDSASMQAQAADLATTVLSQL